MLTINGAVAPPTISVPSGTYALGQSVTLADAMPGAAIHYTLDGTVPTAASTLYSSPVTVGTSLTLKAVAVASGWSTSTPASAVYHLHTIATIAGIFWPTSGNGGPATSAQLHYVPGVAVDASGDLFIADNNNNVIRKVDAATGHISTIAGTGFSGYSGDGGPATSAILNNPLGIRVDAAGNIYFADHYNHVIRKINGATGIISTVAGQGFFGYSGDGGPATSAALWWPTDVSLDATGNLFIADWYNNVIRKVDKTTGFISTVAGTGTSGYSGNGGAATSAKLSYPTSVVVDGAGNLYITDSSNHVIRQVNGSNGRISTVAGTGTSGNSGDGGAALNATLSYPQFLALDAGGNVFVTDGGNNNIRRIDASSATITTVAGTGVAGFSGDGGLATSALLHGPSEIAFDAAGNLFITDGNNNAVRRLDAATGHITTVAGNGEQGMVGDGGLASAAEINVPLGIATDGALNVYIADSGNNVIRRVDGATGIITTVVGTGVAGYSGDGGQAALCHLNYPKGVALDSAGNIYVTDTMNAVIRKVDVATGVITTVAGTGGLSGYTGDGGPATSAKLSYLNSVTVDLSGNLFLADTYNNVVRRVDALSGVITTVAGTGSSGSSGNGGLATAAKLNAPNSVAVDSSGNLYIADTNNTVVRKVSAATGFIAVVAGTSGAGGYSGDGGAATAAKLSHPSTVVLDANANLFFTDTYNQVVREVAAGTGIITTVAGTGAEGYAGDGGLAVNAVFGKPTGLAVDLTGALYITDGEDYVVRRVN